MRGRYVPRSIEPLAVREVAGWRLKVTRVLAPEREGEEALVEAALEEAERFLPTPAVGEEHEGVGIVLVHQGDRYDFVLVGCWTFGTELRYQTFMRASTDSAKLEPLTSHELATDVWDLKVLAFERDAYVEHVLRGKPHHEEASADVASRLETYLQTRLRATL
jgi:hypothetical protein